MYGLLEDTAAPAHSTSYDRKKATEAARQRKYSAAGREIGPIPACTNPELRALCEESLRKFALTCFPDKFYIELADMHETYFERLETAIRLGENIADALPRGSGKTTMARIACIWAIVCGLRCYALLIGATTADTHQNIDAIKKFLSSAGPLADLFPEACFPIAALQQTSQRANGQTCEGTPTGLVFRKDIIVLATLPGSKCSGAILECASMTGRIRGRNFETPSGQSLRPDLAFVDDPQTKGSARSDVQCKARESTIVGDVLGLVGPGKTLTVILLGTVIRDNDVVDRFLDNDKNPSWHGRRIPMVISWPKAEKEWDRYRVLRAEAMRRRQPTTEATEYYLATFDKMNEGAEVSWPGRRKPDEVSGLQCAMNMLFDKGEEEFAAEYQNEPIRHQGGDRPDLTALAVESKIAGPNLPRGKIPLNCDKLVAFIDVQDRLLFYMVLAVGPAFNGHIVEYGPYPQQDRGYFTARDARRTLKLKHQGEGLEGAIYAGIHALADILQASTWTREDGAEFSIAPFVLIDEGDNGKTVQRAVRECTHRNYLMTAKGMGLGAADTPLRENKRKEGDGQTIGDFWVCRPLPNVRGQRRLLVDTNEAKSFAAARLEALKGDRGSITIYHESPTHHQMLTDHLTAENRHLQEAKGRQKEIWRNDNRRENHFWDTFVGCIVAASMQGYKLQPTTTIDKAPPAKPKERKKAKIRYI